MTRRATLSEKEMVVTSNPRFQPTVLALRARPAAEARALGGHLT